MKPYLKLSGQKTNSTFSEVASRYGLVQVTDTHDSGKTHFEKDGLVFKSNRKVFLKGDFRRHQDFMAFIQTWLESRFSDALLEQSTFPKVACLLVKEMLQAEHLLLKTPILPPKDFTEGPLRQILIHTVNNQNDDKALQSIQRIKRLLCLHLKKAGIFFVKEQHGEDPASTWGVSYSVKTLYGTYRFSLWTHPWKSEMQEADVTYAIEELDDSVARKERDEEVAHALLLELLDWTTKIEAYQWNEEKGTMETALIEKRFVVGSTYHTSKEALIASEEERLAQQRAETKMRLDEALKEVSVCQEQEKEQARKKALLQDYKRDITPNNI